MQGSYRNATNIYGDSDVDVVVQVNKTFHRDLSRLSDAEQQAYNASYSAAEYLEAQLKADVRTALESKFGKASVTPGKKVFLVKTGIGEFTADVLPAFQYRNYHRFKSMGDQQYTEGICFHDSDGNFIVNYPKQHIDNGQQKNSKERTNGWYKTAVRMFKNARNTCTERGMLTDGSAPSYFLEGLLYNVPDSAFGTSYQQTYVSVMRSLHGMRLSSCMCQNGQLALFGASSVQWNEIDANATVTGLIRLWNNW